MNRKIIVNHKEFKMEKMSADTYMEYLELAEQMTLRHPRERQKDTHDRKLRR